jgi:hypothetical protein
VKHATFLLVLAMTATVVHAEKGKSIMFGDQDPLYQERTRDTSADTQAEHCKALKRRIDSLSLRPLSRNAAIQRYQLECVQNTGDVPRSSISP